MAWIIEKGDLGGIEVFEGDPGPYDINLADELEAVEYGISCAEGWIEPLKASVASLKARRRALKRKAKR